MQKDGSHILRWIAVFKLLKAVVMLLVGVGLLRIMHHDSVSNLDYVVTRLGVDPGRGYVDLVIGKLVSIPPYRLREFGFGSFVYAGFFLTEAFGLWFGKSWAEWFTSILTASLIPLEVYEFARHPTLGKAAALAVNIAIVAYLLWRIRMKAARQNEPALATR